MARALWSDYLTDTAGNVWANAVATIYTDAAGTVLATDAFTAASGGSAVTTITANSAGLFKVFFTTPKSFWLSVADNGDTAYPVAGGASLAQSFTTFLTPELQAFEPPSDEETDDTTLATVVTGLADHLADTVDAHDASAVSAVASGGFTGNDVQDAIDQLGRITLSGTYAARPAVGTAGRRYIATWASGAIRREYYDTGSAWVPVSSPPGRFNPLDYGADPTGAADSKAAIEACFTAANTAITTGGPVGDGNSYGEIEWTTGQYLASASITIPAQAQRWTAVGGGAGSFQWRRGATITFTTGGFTTVGSVSDIMQWEGITVYGAPALTVNEGSGPGLLRDSFLRSTATGQPALYLHDTFWGWFENTVFYAFDTSSPSIVIDTLEDAPDFEGWLFRWINCRFEKAGVRWNIEGSHTTVVGDATLFESCDTENFTTGAAGALLTIRNTHATENTTFQSVEFRNCSHNDGGGDILVVDAVGTGTILVGSAAFYSTEPASTYHVRHVSTGGGNSDTDKILIVASGQPAVLFTGSAEGYGYMALQSGSSWSHVGDRTTALVLRAKVDGDSQDRYNVDDAGKHQWGAGSGVVDTNLYRSAANVLASDDAMLAVLGFQIGASDTPLTRAGAGIARFGDSTTDAYVEANAAAASAAQFRWLKDEGLKWAVYVPGGSNDLVFHDSATKMTVGASSLTFADAFNLVVNATTGTKIGTATSQKLGFWNAAPIVQPTTGVAEATFVENAGGTAVNVDSTFDGYTVQQVVKALRNAGLLA